MVLHLVKKGSAQKRQIKLRVTQANFHLPTRLNGLDRADRLSECVVVYRDLEERVSPDSHSLKGGYLDLHVGKLRLGEERHT